MSTISPSPSSTATRATRAAPISKSCAARRYFVEKPPLTDYADLERRLAERRASMPAVEIPPGFGRDIARGRPVWVGAWIDGAMPFSRRDDPRLSAGHAPALSRPTRRVKTTRPAAAAAREYRDPVQLQPGFRQRLRHGAVDHGAAAGVVPGDPDGARHRARKGAWLDHQPLRHAGDAARIPARQAAALCRGRDGQFRSDVR